MNRFRKLDDGSWGIVCEEHYEPGEEAVVERKDGTCEILRVGEWVATAANGDNLYRIARSVAAPKAKPTNPEDLPF
jgi:hypothetical protein